jgi:hypothetical protein
MRSLANLRVTLLVVLYLLISAPAGAQTLIYALSYGETRASFHARFPTGALGASINDKLAMLRSYRKTEIYSLSMSDGKRALLFSDEGMNFEITPANPAAVAGKAYVVGVEREWRTVPNPGAYTDPSAIYKISLDGSNKFRRLFAIRPNQTSIQFSREANKAAFETYEHGKYMVFVYEVPSWKLLYTWDLSRLVDAHCSACLPMSHGWLADGKRLFFNLDLGAEEEDDDDAAAVGPSSKPVAPGIYIAAADGTDLGGLPPRAGHPELRGYVRQENVTPSLIAQLPDGSYPFRDFALRKDILAKAPMELEPFLVYTAPDFTARKHIPLQRLRLSTYTLSPSGKYLAYVEDRQTPDYRTERHVWAMDLESGTEKELLAAPPPNPPTSPQPNVTLTVVGWQ